MVPAIKWLSSSDQTALLAGISCSRVDYAPELSSKGAWNRFWKLLEGLGELL